MLYYVILYHTILYYIILYYIISYHIIPYYIYSSNRVIPQQTEDLLHDFVVAPHPHLRILCGGLPPWRPGVPSEWDQRHINDHRMAILTFTRVQDGAPKIAKLPNKWSGFMVDVTIVNGGYNGL